MSLKLCLTHKQERWASHYTPHNCDYCNLEAERDGLLKKERKDGGKKIMVKDIYGTEVSLQFSRSGYYRFDLEGESFPKSKDKMGNEIPVCLSFNEDQIRIIYHTLSIMLENE